MASGQAWKCDRPLAVNGLEMKTTNLTSCTLTITKRTSAQVRVVVRGGVEPSACRFSGASVPSLHVAGRGLIGHLAAQTMARCRLTWPDACRRWLPFGPRNRGTRAVAGALRLITAGQVIGTLQVTHRRQESRGGPADETFRSGIGGRDVSHSAILATGPRHHKAVQRRARRPRCPDLAAWRAPDWAR